MKDEELASNGKTLLVLLTVIAASWAGLYLVCRGMVELAGLIVP